MVPLFVYVTPVAGLVPEEAVTFLVAALAVESCRVVVSSVIDRGQPGEAAQSIQRAVGEKRCVEVIVAGGMRSGFVNVRHLSAFCVAEAEISDLGTRAGSAGIGFGQAAFSVRHSLAVQGGCVVDEILLGCAAGIWAAGICDAGYAVQSIVGVAGDIVFGVHALDQITLGRAAGRI